MAEPGGQDYLSIGEVLGILLEEFPDVTISKIRFLESQGLIDPERTPSGYRKFYEADVELLRVILREQRENYLPLRVIKDRIETGVIDPSGELAKPSPTDTATGDPVVASTSSDETIPTEGVEVPAGSVANHPAAGASVGASALAVDGATTHHRPAGPSASTPAPEPEQRESGEQPEPPEPPGVTHDGRAHSGAADGGAGASATSAPSPARLLPGVLIDRTELCTLVGMTGAQLDELERFGVVKGRASGGGTLYGDDAVEIASAAVELLRAGLDARHLRGYRTSADREVSLYEQLVTPRLRQRSPAARAEALDHLHTLDELGGRLRAALTRTALRHHFDT